MGLRKVKKYVNVKVWITKKTKKQKRQVKKMQYKLSVRAVLTAAQIEKIYPSLKNLFDDQGIKSSIKLAVASDTKKQTAAARAARANKRKEI